MVLCPELTLIQWEEHLHQMDDRDFRTFALYQQRSPRGWHAQKGTKINPESAYQPKRETSNAIIQLRRENKNSYWRTSTSEKQWPSTRESRLLFLRPFPLADWIITATIHCWSNENEILLSCLRATSRFIKCKHFECKIRVHRTIAGMVRNFFLLPQIWDIFLLAIRRK